MNTSFLDIELPPIAKAKLWVDAFESFDQMISDILIYVCYVIAVLCGIKFIIYILNGFATKSYMGTSSMGDTSLSR